MTPQERELLEGLFARVRAASAAPRDAEAEAYIAEQARLAPHAAYLLSQTVIVQEEALKAAAAKIDELNARVGELEEAQRAAPAQPSSFLGGIGKSLFGGDEPRPAQRGSVPSAGGPRDYSPPEPVAARPAGIGMPNVAAPGSRWTQQGRAVGAQEQPQQGGGGSFLKGALGAAAGVAGGMLLANSLSGLLKDNGNPLGIADGKAGQKPETAAASPASEQNQPWGSDSRQETSSAADEGYEEDLGCDDQADLGGGDWSEDV